MVFILGWEWNVKSQDFHKQGWLAAWLSREIQPCDNRTASCPILSCSALASMTLQLLACLALLARVHLLAAWSRESLFSCTLLSISTLYLTHCLTTIPPNTGLLIAEIQANLARNKANKMVDKIQPYNSHELVTKITSIRVLLALVFGKI